MNHEPSDEKPLSSRERRAVRRAVVKGEAISDPSLQPYAQRRAQSGTTWLRLFGQRLAASRQRRAVMAFVIIIGLALLASGHGNGNTALIALGATDLGLGILLTVNGLAAGWWIENLASRVSGASQANAPPAGKPGDPPK
jgi:hypothetical protein